MNIQHLEKLCITLLHIQRSDSKIAYNNGAKDKITSASAPLWIKTISNTQHSLLCHSLAMSATPTLAMSSALPITAR